MISKCGPDTLRPVFFMNLRTLASISMAFMLWGCSLISPQSPMRTLYWSGIVEIRTDFEISEGTRLIIAPGTRILFYPHEDPSSDRNDHPYFPGAELIVFGHIEAAGTMDAPIVFSSASKKSVAGSWGGVNLEEGATGFFRYSEFRQADSAIHARSAQVEISRCLFEDNLVGIRFNNSAMLIEDNLLRRNQVGIRFHLGAPVICHNRIEHNDKGLFITSYPRDYRIMENDFLDNRQYQVILGELVPDDVNLGGNYWGQAAPEELERSFYDGRLDDYLGKIIYVPRSDAPFTKEGLPWTQ